MITITRMEMPAKAVWVPWASLLILAPGVGLDEAQWAIPGLGDYLCESAA